MKIVIPFLCYASLVASSFGQSESSQTSVENAPVLDEVVYQHGKDTLIIQRIEQPEFLGKNRQDQPSPSSPEEVDVPQQELMPTQTYIIAATRHTNQKTHLKIWPSHLGERGAMKGWSNIDWSVLKSLLSFEDGTTRYQFMLFHSDHSSSQNHQHQLVPPTELPDFSDSGARYLVTSSEETERELTLDFLESLHALYDDSHEELHQNHAIVLARNEERKRQIEREAAKPKTRVLKIWRHTRPEEKQVSE
tara:strand:+ start:223 stop:969 length:747 start_codon:yes stop_codon:yes gene_type:complete